MDNRTYFERKDENVVVEELSSLTTIPEDQMVTVQEEVITTVDTDTVQKPLPISEEVMDEGQAPKRDPDQIAAIEKRRKLTLKPKPVKTETGKIKKKKSKGAKKEKGRRKVSAYLLYSRHMRPSVAKENADLKMIEVTSKLAKMWNELDDNDKEYWKSKEAEENSKVVVEKKKSKKKKKVLAPLAPDGPPEALDLAAHLKLLGDSITKMGEITGELAERGDSDYSELTVSALLTNLLNCLLCASAPLLYLTSHVEQLNVISEEKQIRMLDNIAYIMPGLENFKA
ncbi:HMG box-containing protein 4-like [Bolinopsis microptera]|uniref:HMG box-containing protein 4-like n=1 Tax=Bolinopsis microptera TaxID=2820187 RepID=UPI00307921E8